MNRPQNTRTNNQSGRTNQRRRSQTKRRNGVDIWRDTGELPELQPVVVPSDAGALLRSLGDPPLNNGMAAGYYFTTVVERAAAVAYALAFSADVLAKPDADG